MKRGDETERGGMEVERGRGLMSVSLVATSGAQLT